MEHGDSILATVRPGNKTYYYFRDCSFQDIVSTGYAVLTPIKEISHPRFLYYAITSNDFIAYLVQNEKGATYPAVDEKIITNGEIPFPPFDTQERIANILSAYDDLIENNQKQIKLLEEAAQRLYKEWFVDFRFPGYENAKFIDGIPEGWRKDVIDSKIEILSGYAFKSNDFDSDGKFKIVTIKNVKDGEFDGENVNCIIDIPTKMPSHCKLYDKDILLSLTGNVGRVCMINGDGYLLNQRVAKLKSDIHSYTYCLFRSKYMFDKMNNLANGAAQQNLSPIKTGKIKVIFPTNELLSKFEVLVESIISKINITNRNIIKLTQARDHLLPKLMSGEIEV